ncbi:hypothetical protein POM88_000695 [Heracleum sosnowskyi]|uniref:Replication factor A C-terminal domain-containing protein n=1 Tax=Heracleum sosnowskyi TaxID=360622 RepID=A0AAD8HEB5_9APIA|nr:hypothetical protein POM88_041476 [Heracleum sosnowskyi]KAK1401090.1 hypothetical protein POM88_000695 [Heracleum sosnowskyi]
MLLLDDDNTHMHAFVYPENWKPIEKDMVEAEDDFMIPKHKFDFVDLSDLFALASGFENIESPEFSTDIIGVIEDFERVKPINTMFGEKNIVKFRITDGRYSHRVTVWGKLAVTTDAIYDKIVDRPIIAIIASSKLKIYRSSVQISTLPSSKIYLNLDSEFVSAMLLRLEEEGYKAPENVVAPPVEAPVIPVIQTLTLRELLGKTNSDDIKKNFMCYVKITNVEETGNWWYYSCSYCLEEAYKLEGKFKCSKCPKSTPVAEKRYRIVVLAGDSTEALNFVLFDRAAKRILSESATKMLSDNITTVGYPLKIKAMAGKEVTFNVTISSDNVLLNSKIFNVTDAYVTTFSESSPSEETVNGVSISSYSEEK